MIFFTSKLKKDKLDAATNALLDLQVRKKELELAIDSLKLDLQNKTKAQEQERLELQNKFSMEKKNWEEDKARLKRELESEHKMKLLEAVTLAKLDSEQKVKQAELDRDRKINEIKADYNEKVAEIKAKLSEESYQKLSASLTKLHEEGNVNTKFTQELALKMFEKAPPTTSRMEVLTGTVDQAE